MQPSNISSRDSIDPAAANFGDSEPPQTVTVLFDGARLTLRLNLLLQEAFGDGG
jgi:hypothetical protein